VNLQSYACSTDCAVATMRIKLSIGPQITLAVVSYSRYLVVILESLGVPLTQISGAALDGGVSMKWPERRLSTLHPC